MDFNFTEMQQMLIDSAARLMKNRSSIEYWRERRNLPDGCDSSMWNQFAELGWLGLVVPEDAGGIGGSMEDVALLMVELGRGLATDPIVSSAILGVHVLDQLVEGAQREALLGAIVGGEVRVALAHGEAGDRYELSRPRKTTASRDGDGYVLNGQKMLAMDAPSAHQLLVTAALEGEEGYGIFLVPADVVGLSLTAYPLIDGSRAADLDLSGVALPTSALIGSGVIAAAVLKAGLDRAEVALMGQAVGAMETAVSITGDYAKERKQFGQPIGKFQAIQHMAADMFVASYEGRSALYQLLAHIDGTDAECDRAISIARIIIGQAVKTVGENGVQIHGGYGVTDEYAISHYYRRLLSLTRQQGDVDHHLGRMVGAGAAVA